MDQAYDSLTLGDMEEIKADYRRPVAKNVKGYAQKLALDTADTYGEYRAAEQAYNAGDRSPEVVSKARVVKVSNTGKLPTYFP